MRATRLARLGTLACNGLLSRPALVANPASRNRLCSSSAAAAEPHPLANHRDLGRQQDLFLMTDYSPGSPMFLPAGTRVFNRLVSFLRDAYVRHGFDEVITPTMYKMALWERSGHLDSFGGDMFAVTGGADGSAISDRPEIVTAGVDPSVTAGAASTADADIAGWSAGDASAGSAGIANINATSLTGQAGTAKSPAYGLKPMNCPGHCLIFAARPRSHRDLPLRLADFGALHRNEASGTLRGLMRVRRFHQDDGHVFCRPAQIEGEIARALLFVEDTYSKLGLGGSWRLALSTRPPASVGSDEEWAVAEAALKRALDAYVRPGAQIDALSRPTTYTLNPGDGAFYGPKIDILVSSHGREFQTATVQLDFQLPKRFNLEYMAPNPATEWQGLEGGRMVVDMTNQSHAPHSQSALPTAPGPVRPVMIHRAVLGSVERLMALLLEHHAGRWPFWLNPRQAVVITVNDSPAVVEWAKAVAGVLTGVEPASRPQPTHFSVDVDASARTVGLKIREAKSRGYGVIFVVGAKNVKARTVTADASAIVGRLNEEMSAEEALSMMEAAMRAFR